MRNNNAESVVNLMVDTDTSFELQCSNYSMKIINDEMNVSFVANMQGKKVFAAYAKLKSALHEQYLPDIKREDLTYFLHNFKQTQHIGNVCNIDLKSAYANVLYLDGLIPKQVFDFISKMQKPDRLACVGMLASRKDCYNFEKGRVANNHETVSLYAPFFYYAVKRTFDIMLDLKKICGSDYLFTWVDGIYFRPQPAKKRLIEYYLRKIKFPFSSDVLTDFDVKHLPRRIFVSFKKQDERKTFNIPIQPTGFQKAMHTGLLLSNNKNKEKKSWKKQ